MKFDSRDLSKKRSGPTKFVDLSGKKFGRWKVLDEIKRVNGIIHWKCECECGVKRFVNRNALTRKKSQSCGCLNREIARDVNIIHGHVIGVRSDGKKATKEYTAWQSIKQRCYGKNQINYYRYGGRGIKMCDRWRSSFINFYRDMGDCPKGYSFGRINNDGHYEPNNCRWESDYQQRINRSDNRHFVMWGKKLTVSQISFIFDVSYHWLYFRLVTQKKSLFEIRKNIPNILIKEVLKRWRVKQL